MNQRTKKIVLEALARDYTPVFERMSKHRWFVTYKELDGCMADGKTKDEALKELRSVEREWLIAFVEDNPGKPVPLPMEAAA